MPLFLPRTHAAHIQCNGCIKHLDGLFSGGQATKEGGGWGKDCAAKEKRTFIFLFSYFIYIFLKICSRCKIKYILLETTYPNIIISVLVHISICVGRQTYNF